MVRVVAVVLLALFGTVHAWAGFDGDLPGRAFLPGEYVMGHAVAYSAKDHGITSRNTSMQGIGNCCPGPDALVASSFFQCTLDNMIIVSLNAVACPSPVHKGSGFYPVRTASEYKGYIFRPPII